MAEAGLPAPPALQASQAPQAPQPSAQLQISHDQPVPTQPIQHIPQ